MDWLAFLEAVAIECVLSPDQKRAFLARFDRKNAGKTEKWIADNVKDDRGDLVFSGEAAYKKLMTLVYKAFQVSLFPELATIAKGKREKLGAWLKVEFERRSMVVQEEGRSELRSDALSKSGMKPGAPLPDNFVASTGALEAVKAKSVLILPASPDSAMSQRCIDEIGTIRQVSEKSNLPVNVKVEERPYARPSDIPNYFAQIQPDIVHISGETDGITDLLIGKGLKNSSEVENLIGEFLKLNAQKVECIVLSGCYSEKQIRVIAYHIKFVICIYQNLKLEQSRNFIDTFYYQIRSGKSINDSYLVSSNSLQRTTTLQQSDLPGLFTKEQEVRTRKLEEELEFWRKKIEYNPGDSALWKELAKLLEDLNRIDEMNEAYERVVSLEPKNYKNRVKQADALERLGDHEKGKSAYNQAIELGGGEKDYKVWWSKANAHSKAKEYWEANQSYKKALVLVPPLSPDNYVICTEYAVTLGKLKQFSESIQYYGASLFLEPNYRVARYHRNKMYKKIYSE